MTRYSYLRAPAHRAAEAGAEANASWTRRHLLLILTFVGISLAGGRPAYAQSRPPEWKLTRLYSVGAEADTVVLQRVGSLQLLRDQRLLIADAGARSVLVVDSLGRSRPALGRA